MTEIFRIVRKKKTLCVQQYCCLCCCTIRIMMIWYHSITQQRHDRSPQASSWSWRTNCSDFAHPATLSYASPLQVVQHTTCSRALPGVGLPPVGERQAALYGALRCFARSRNRPRHCAPHVFSTFGYDRNLSVVQPHGRCFRMLASPSASNI